jgi:hypothetical protein
MYQTQKALSRVPTPSNKGLIGLPASSGVTSINQLNTQQGLLEK